MTAVEVKSDTELQLELELWTARAESLQNANAALNAQAQLLKQRSGEVQENLKRVQHEIQCRKPGGAIVQPQGGGGPGEGDGTGGGP